MLKKKFVLKAGLLVWILLSIVACGAGNDSAGSVGSPSSGGSSETTGERGDGSAPEFSESATEDIPDSMADTDDAMDVPLDGEEPRLNKEPPAGQLTAGDIDDNLNPDLFNKYVNSKAQQESFKDFPTLSVSDRIKIEILDKKNKPISNAALSIRGEGQEALTITSFTNTSGIFYFSPNNVGLAESEQFEVTINTAETGEGTQKTLLLSELDKNRTFTIVLKKEEASLPQSLDLMFVLDTTGSMRDELDYLTREFEGILGFVESHFPNLSTRLSLTVYRDHGDDYVVQSHDFDSSIDNMQSLLGKQEAQGGGDYPEAMDEALAEALEADWRGGNTARVMFLVADAPPHEGKVKKLFEAVKKATEKGIRIYPIGASGVAEESEYLMRLAAFNTQARYLFLTDDSEIGNSHNEPEIPCYQVTELENLIRRVLSSELTGRRIEPETNDIYRTVGNYNNGRCESSEQI